MAAQDIQELLQNDYKIYVQVEETRTAEGKVIPRVIVWEDGEQFEIDEVTDVRPKASLKGGGAGLRYTIRIGNKTTYMWLEQDRWFVEKR